MLSITGYDLFLWPLGRFQWQLTSRSGGMYVGLGGSRDIYKDNVMKSDRTTAKRDKEGRRVERRHFDKKITGLQIIMIGHLL